MPYMRLIWNQIMHRLGVIRMADTHPTKLIFFRACRLCVLAVFSPQKFQVEQDRYPKLLEQSEQTQRQNPRSNVLYRAFWSSLIHVVLSASIGFAAAMIFSYLGFVSSASVTTLQIVGALLLLWATLFVRGWEIQTWCGSTLLERINRWIYRALCCLGTSLLVFSLSLPLFVK